MIRNSEDANKYYELVNKFIDEYVDLHKIRPSKLSVYLKNNDKLRNFLKKSGLSDSSDIKRIIDDVLADREAMEKDGVLTFENYIFENSSVDLKKDLKDFIYLGIGKSNIIHEKLLSNFFSVSLSNLDVVDSDNHIFIVDDVGKKKCCLVFSDEELTLIVENLKEFVEYKVSSYSVSLDEIGLKIPILDILDESNLSSFLNQRLSMDSVKEILSDLYSCKSLSEEGFVGVFD